MTRYFRFEYLDVVDFLKLENVDVLLRDGKFQDGKVVALYSLDNSNRTEQIMKKVAELQVLMLQSQEILHYSKFLKLLKMLMVFCR